MTRRRLLPVTHTDALFATQSQSILDDLVALLGQSSPGIARTRTSSADFVHPRSPAVFRGIPALAVAGHSSLAQRQKGVQASRARSRSADGAGKPPCVLPLERECVGTPG